MTGLQIKTLNETGSGIKKILAVALMLIFYFQIWASNGPGFAEGAQLYVMANSGLTLRQEPNKDSEILEVVGFGSTVHVLSQPDSTLFIETINWVEGRWLYVEFDGVKGYMFDGYLSDLPLPIYEFEKCQLDLDLIYPLESWVDVNLGEKETKLIDAGALRKLTSEYVGGERLIISQKNEDYKLELFLSDVRLMDAYHLLQSMIENRTRLETFSSESIFVNNRDGDLYKVNINLDNPIVIRKLDTGGVKITIRSDNYVCSL